jgi:hypothetical protein
VLIVLHLGRYAYWFGFQRKWPFPLGAGRELEHADLTYGITLEVV